MKKICILIKRYFTFGGKQKIVSDIANVLSENGNYEITICTLDNKKIYYDLNRNINIDYKYDLSYRKRNIIQKLIGYCVYKGLIKIKNASILKFVYFPNKRVKKLDQYLLENKYDIVISVGAELSMLLCSTNNRCKKIGWQHNSFNAYFRTKGIKCYGTEILAKELFKNLDVNVVLGEEIKKDYDKYMKDVNTKIIYNPLTIQPIITEGLYSSNLIFVGRLVKFDKGLDYLTEILGRLYKYNQNFKCYIVGDGVDRKYLIKEIRLRGLVNNVELVGETQDVTSYYTKSSILLNTSRFEGFGLVYIEAMSCGVVPISFDNNGSKEIIDNNVDGYIIKNFDTSKYAKTINYLLHDDKKRKELSLNAIEKSKKFDVNKILEIWNETLI